MPESRLLEIVLLETIQSTVLEGRQPRRWNDNITEWTVWLVGV